MRIYVHRQGETYRVYTRKATRQERAKLQARRVVTTRQEIKSAVEFLLGEDTPPQS